MLTTHYSTQRHYGSHILQFFHLLLQCRTPYAVEHSLVLLKMGTMMPETCWDRCLTINIRLVASCWFLSLHPTFMMHGHKSLKNNYVCSCYKCVLSGMWLNVVCLLCMSHTWTYQPFVTSYSTHHIHKICWDMSKVWVTI